MTILHAVRFQDMSRAEQHEVLRWRNHASIRRCMFTSTPISLPDHLKFIRALNTRPTVSYWMVRTPEGTGVGVVSLTDISVEHRRACVGIYRNPFIRIPGAGKHLLQVLEHIARRIHHLRIIRAEVLETNHRAQRFFSAHGFVFEGVLRDYIRRANTYLDVQVFSKVVRKAPLHDLHIHLHVHEPA